MANLVPEKQPEIKDDWTRDPSTGRSNSSPEFLQLEQVVVQLLSDGVGGFILSPDWIESKARFILAKLAHDYGLAPTRK